MSLIQPSYLLPGRIRTATARLITPQGHRERRVKRSRSEATVSTSTIQSQGALRESTPPSIDRVPARPLAAKPLPKPFSACMIRAESNFNRINPSRSGRERSVSKSSLMAWRQHSGVTRLRAADVHLARTSKGHFSSFWIKHFGGSEHL